MKFVLLASLVVSLKMAHGSVYVEYSATNTPVPIPEFGASNGDYAFVDIIVPRDGCVIEDVDLVVRATHTFIGDLSMTLTHPNGVSTVGLMERPGTPSPEPDASLGFDSDLLDTTLTFDDSSSNDPEALGDGLGDMDVIMSTDVFSVGGLSGPPFPAGSLKLLDLIGLSPLGTWTLIVADHAAVDTGVIEEATLKLTLECGDCGDSGCGK